MPGVVGFSASQASGTLISIKLPAGASHILKFKICCIAAQIFAQSSILWTQICLAAAMEWL
jgi:hypothetical protein